MSDWARLYGGRRAVVLGASGFIGRWTARLLRDCGARVIAVGRDRAAVEQALGVARGDIDVVVQDFVGSDPQQWLGDLEPDIVFNLIGYGVDRGERDAALAQRLNHEFVAQLTRAVASLGGASWPHVRLVHTGSALEYGTTEGVLREDSPTAATTDYGKTKLAGSMALVHEAQARQCRALVARLFTVYGPGEHAGRLLPSVLSALESGAQVPMSDGLQQRDFTYVEDVAEGLLRLAVSGAEPGMIVNLASGVMQSVHHFVLTAAGVAGIAQDRFAFGALPRREEEMRQTAVAIDRLTALVGWRPSEDIARGVGRTLSRLAEPR